MANALKIAENVVLAPYTTFQIGGPARWFAEARDEEGIVAAVNFARERQLKLFVLGGGSNVLVEDTGFDGLVLHMVSSGIEQVEDQGTFAVAAGEDWDNFVSFAVARNYGGTECLAGIPGTVGGTPIQNVGAYGQEVSSTIRLVRAYDLHSNSFVELQAAECQFAYRQSIFNTSQRSRYIVTRVFFALQHDAKPDLSYTDLKQYFNSAINTPTLGKTAEAVRKIRDAKGMLLVPGEPDCRSAGSFFKNPIVPESALKQVAVALCIDAETIPRYPAANGNVKLPAAWLLEKAGFHKGYKLGPAAISNRHTLALTNRGGATSADIEALRDQIVNAIQARFGIHLEQEPIQL
jgi:UDP-N-acetylmuramate dehydrogenase